MHYLSTRLWLCYGYGGAGLRTCMNGLRAMALASIHIYLWRFFSLPGGCEREHSRIFIDGISRGIWKGFSFNRCWGMFSRCWRIEILMGGESAHVAGFNPLVWIVCYIAYMKIFVFSELSMRKCFLGSTVCQDILIYLNFRRISTLHVEKFLFQHAESWKRLKIKMLRSRVKRIFCALPTKVFN